MTAISLVELPFFGSVSMLGVIPCAGMFSGVKVASSGPEYPGIVSFSSGGTTGAAKACGAGAPPPPSVTDFTSPCIVRMVISDGGGGMFGFCSPDANGEVGGVGGSGDPPEMFIGLSVMR